MFRTFVLLPAMMLFSSFLLSAQTCRAQCCESECEPRLKFLDDLVRSNRDPYEERIETDRHDFTQSTTTVGRGVVQLEAGYSYFYVDENKDIEQAHTTPEMMIRMGLSDDIEFRVRWTYAWSFLAPNEDSEGEKVESAEDLRMSFKLRMTDQDCWLPESALEIRFTAPTGGAGFSTQRSEFGLDYIYGWAFCEDWELYGSTGFGSNALGDFGLVPEEPARERFIAWSQSFAIGVELTERTSLYNEIYGIFSYGLDDNYAITIYNVGLDYYVTDDLVLDLRAGVGLTPDSDDFFTGVGGGYRF